jgi:hypothetical protein
MFCEGGGCPFRRAPPDFLAIAPAAVPCPLPPVVNDRPTTDHPVTDRTRDGISPAPVTPPRYGERETPSPALTGSPLVLSPNS